MVMKKTYLPLDIQFFADGKGTESTESDLKDKDDNNIIEEEKGDTGDSTTSKGDDKKYSQDEVNEIVKQRIAREKKEREEAIKEAEKLAKMNAQQKQEYELEKLRKENEELKAAQNRYELGKEASRMLVESGITADDDVLAFVVRDDAEATGEAVKAFAGLVDQLAEQRMLDKLKGKSPRTQMSPTATMTKEEIMKVQDTEKRHKLIRENMHLFQ